MSAAVVVFDFGGVLAPPHDRYAKLASHLGVAIEELMPVYWRHRPAYELGAPGRWYWAEVGHDLGHRVDAGSSDALVQIDLEGWLRLAPDGAALLRELPGRVALLSNAPIEFAQAARRQEWAEQFEFMLFSAEARLAKPDRRIYALLSELLAGPVRILFFDDTMANVLAARDCGWEAQLWRDVEQGRQALAAADILRPV